MHLSIKKVHYDNPTIKYDFVKLSQRELKSLQYTVGYVVPKLYSKFKFSKNKDCAYSKLCLSIMLCFRIDSDGTQTLINAKDRGVLRRVNETVQNIFIECEEIFHSFTSAFDIPDLSNCQCNSEFFKRPLSFFVSAKVHYIFHQIFLFYAHFLQWV